MTALISDLRFALRSIRRVPLVSGVIVISLAVGIGVNTAVFTWMQAVVLRPLPGVADASAIYLVEPRADTGSYPGASWPEYRDLQQRLRAFPDLLAYRMTPLNVGDRGRTERTYALLVSGNYFSALGVRAELGRVLRTDEAATPGGAPVAVVSHGFWTTRLGSDRQAVGRTLRVNDRVLTIVGVTPDRFQGTVLGLNFDLWVPATLAPELLGGSRELDDRTQRGYSLMGRLAPPYAIDAARQDVSGAMRTLADTYPATNARIGAEVLPFWQAPRGPQRLLASALAVLQTIVLLLLLAVCANTASLVLARVSTRRREIGMRLAMGATRWDVARLVLLEQAILALCGVAAGVALAIWGTDALRAVPIIGAFPIRFQTYLDAVSVAFAVALAAASGLVIGIAPAVQLARTDPQSAVRSGARDEGRSSLRHAVIGVEVALALLVLMAAGLFVRSFAETRATDPGFRADGVLLASYDDTGGNLDTAAVRQFTRRLLEQLNALPDVESAAIAASVPLDIHGLPMRSFSLEGRASTTAAADRTLSNTVTPGYFRTMGIPFEAGRDFSDVGDARAPAEAIVNDEFVRRFVGDAAALGRHLTMRAVDYTIVGIVRNSVSEAFGEPPMPVLYLSYRDRPSARGEIHVRTRAGAETLLTPSIERVVRTLDPELPLYDVRTLSEHIEKNLFLRRIPARMFVVLGPLLLALAAIGIYAVVAYAVSRRRTEIGVRIALGATARRVTGDVVADTFRVIATGALAGWAVAFLVDLHLLRGVIYLSVFAGVPLLLLAVAAVACWIPARRAATADPLRAIRED